MKFRKSILIGEIAFVVAAVLLTTILIFVNNKKDLEDVVGKQLSLSEGLNYCDGFENKNLDDDISKAFLASTSFKVVSIDEKNSIAIIKISAPPVKDILQKCLPNEDVTNFDKAFDTYIEKVIKSISTAQQDELITTTVKCATIETKGLKIVINNDFMSAVYPNIEEMLSELIMESLKETEN